MREKWLRVGAVTFGFFSGLSAFVQIIVLPMPYRIAAFGSTLLCAVVAILLTRRVHAHRNALDALLGALGRRPHGESLVVQNIRNAAELRELWEIDKVSYGDASLTLEEFADWWERYPKGLFALFRGDEIVGGLGIWPIRKTPFIEMLEGRRRERDLSGLSIEALTPAASCKRWYISGVVLLPRVRRTHAVRVLLTDAVRQWVDERAAVMSLDLCALASSSDGEAMLRKFGFRKLKDRKETADHLPLYALLSATPLTIAELTSRLRPAR